MTLTTNMLLAQGQPFTIPDVDVNAALFFFANSTVVMAVVALIFVIIGFWMGFLTWARYKRRARAYQEECDILRHEIASLKRRIAEEAAAPPAVLPMNEDLPAAFRLQLPPDARVTVVEETLEVSAEEGAPRTSGLAAVLSAKTSTIPAALGAPQDEFRAPGEPVSGNIKVTNKTSRIVVREAGAVDKLGDKTTALGSTEAIPIEPLDRGSAGKTSRVLLIESTSTKPGSEPPTEDSSKNKTSRVLLIEKMDSGPLAPMPPQPTGLIPTAEAAKRPDLPSPPSAPLPTQSPIRTGPVPRQPRALTTPTLITSPVAPVPPPAPAATARTTRLDPSLLPSPPTVSLSAELPKTKTSGILLHTADSLAKEDISQPKALPTLPEVPATISSSIPTTSSPFAAELKDGRGTLHPQLGFVYKKKPERYDDLTLMRGVAEALQTRLNQLGFYTFRQIALVSTEQLDHLAEEVGAKERVGKERWQQQARDLHLLKYGERLSQ